MDIPLYETKATSPLTEVLVAKGFSGWYKLDSSSEFAFCKLLSLGLTTHFDISAASFAGAEYLKKLWSTRTQCVSRVWESYSSDQKFSSPEFWTSMGRAMVEDLAMSFRAKTWFNEITAGRILDKGQEDLYKKFLGYIGMSLVWYEWRSNGQVRATPYMSASPNFPQVYITLATEGNLLYLLFHSSFNPSMQYQEGYPYYTKSERDPKIPSLEGVAPSSTGDVKLECIQRQMEVITLLAEMMVKFGLAQLPVEAAADQTRLRDLVGTVTQLVKVCGFDFNPKTPSMESILKVQIVPDSSEPAVPDYHDCSNCESFPNCGPEVNHLGELFHTQCLAYYISQQPDPVTSVLCPRCGRELPDTLVEAVAPHIIAQRKQRVNVHYTAVKGSTIGNTAQMANPAAFMSGPVNFKPGQMAANYGPTNTVPNQQLFQASSPQPQYQAPSSQLQYQASSPQPQYQAPSQSPYPPISTNAPAQFSGNSAGQWTTPPPSVSTGYNSTISTCPSCQKPVLGSWFWYDCAKATCVMCAIANRTGRCPFCQQQLTMNEQQGVALAYSKTAAQ